VHVDQAVDGVLGLGGVPVELQIALPRRVPAARQIEVAVRGVDERETGYAIAVGLLKPPGPVPNLTSRRRKVA